MYFWQLPLFVYPKKENSTSETKCAYQSEPSLVRSAGTARALKIFIPHLCSGARLIYGWPPLALRDEAHGRHSRRRKAPVIPFPAADNFTRAAMCHHWEYSAGIGPDIASRTEFLIAPVAGGPINDVTRPWTLQLFATKNYLAFSFGLESLSSMHKNL